MLPMVTNVVSDLCVTPVPSADAECRERAFWLKEAEHPDSAPRAGAQPGDELEGIREPT